MKRLVNRTPKWLRLVLVLLSTVLLLWIWWQMADYPRLTPRGALHQLERRCQYEQSTLLTTMDAYRQSTRYGSSVVIGVTETRLHLAHLTKTGLFWRPERSDGMVSIPLDESNTLGILPWDVRLGHTLSPRHAALFLYAPQRLAVSGTAAVHIIPDNNAMTYSYYGTLTRQENGLFLFEISHEIGESNHLVSHALEQLFEELQGSPRVRPRKELRLEAQLFDQSGREVLNIEKIYPSTETQ